MLLPLTTQELLPSAPQSEAYAESPSQIIPVENLQNIQIRHSHVVVTLQRTEIALQEGVASKGIQSQNSRPGRSGILI